MSATSREVYYALGSTFEECMRTISVDSIFDDSILSGILCLGGSVFVEFHVSGFSWKRS